MEQIKTKVKRRRKWNGDKLSPVEIKTDGFKVIKNALYKKDDNIKCPNCNSDNITYAKDDGELIIGNKLISLACHDCETNF